MLTETQHAVESNPRVVPSAFVNGNAVNDVTFAQVFEHPEEMLGGDAKHGRADANAGIERDDLVVLQFSAEAVDQVNFGADGPLRACRRSLDGFDDAFGRTYLVGGLGNLEAAIGAADASEQIRWTYVRAPVTRRSPPASSPSGENHPMRAFNPLGN